jgi:hypothetical protein
MTKKHPWAMSDEEAFFADLDRFYDEAGGLMRLFLVRHDDRDWHKAVQAGDPLAVTLAAACRFALGDIAETGTCQCLICNEPFIGTQPHSFAVWLPGTKTERARQHDTIMTQPICAECSTATDRELLEDAVDFLQQILHGAEEIEGSYEGR